MAYWQGRQLIFLAATRPLDLKRMENSQRGVFGDGALQMDWWGERPMSSLPKGRPYLKEAMVQTEPSTSSISAVKQLKINWHKSWVERLVHAEGIYCTWLIFSLLTIKHVFFSPAVMQCSCTLWNHSHILLTGVAAFCIGVKLEPYELVFKLFGIERCYLTCCLTFMVATQIYFFLQQPDIFCNQDRRNRADKIRLIFYLVAQLS